ncbi:Major facilitator superfamily domain-containing protein 8 [Eumeta japonica]|uniref:Major facilitator superfamily domain-containing protein 8 n=1 Tax=Eumeta variegata TaxID=151549 RepID=A0A4C1SI58_EUMVA|nr:Major facilitator superfamily domain-containing protein 8 [Eumeta japonica]
MRPEYVKYWMLASRFLIGVSSANIAVCRSYLSAATRLSERTKAVSMVSLAQVLGFIIGPGLQAVVTPLGSEGYVWLWGGMVFNMYTACGWINVVMSVGNFIMFLPTIFEERKIAAREIMVMQGKSSEKETWKSIKPDYVSAWTLIVAFCFSFNFVLLETLGTSLTMDQFAWSNDEALWYMGILMSVGAIIALITKRLIPPSYDVPEPVELKKLSSFKVTPNTLGSNGDIENEANGGRHIEEDSKLLNSNRKTVFIVAAEDK